MHDLIKSDSSQHAGGLPSAKVNPEIVEHDDASLAGIDKLHAGRYIAKQEIHGAT